MEYLFTERAHLMCPNMYFGMAATVNRPYDEARIQEAFAHLAKAHPFLNSLLGYEEKKNAFFYNVTDSSKVELLPADAEISGIDAPEVMETYRRLTGRDWDLTREGMLKAAVWKADGFPAGISPFAGGRQRSTGTAAGTGGLLCSRDGSGVCAGEADFLSKGFPCRFPHAADQQDAGRESQ